MSPFNPFDGNDWNNLFNNSSVNPQQIIDEMKGQIIDEVMRDVNNLVTQQIPNIVNEQIPNIIEKEIPQRFEAMLPLIAENLKQGGGQALIDVAKVVTVPEIQKFRDAIGRLHDGMKQLEEEDKELVDELDKLGFTLHLACLSMPYTGIYRRTESLLGMADKYLQQPPEFRRKPIIEMITDFAPDSVNFGASINATIVVAGSKEVGVGADLNSISTKLFTVLGDRLLKEVGVPE